ncbi:polysaccharide deacetylase family protein [Polaribacter sp.]|uniref:polysaccharide deacetylase family protein n=1 Tax=Polaribacter sp. TaxID=1920175 RepID=UPI003EF11CD5
MKFYIPKTPSIFFRLFSKYTWRFSLEKKEIFLTFDDGPTPEITQFVLSELEKYNAKATFFCIGKNVKNNPKIFEKIIKNGHSVGNHTQNHFNGWQHTTEAYLDNFLACKYHLDRLIPKPTNNNNNNNNTNKVLKTSQENSTNLKENPKLFRPPYGKIRKNQALEILKRGYKIIMWSVLSADFDTTISKEKCLENVLKNTSNGSIVVFHDSVKAANKLKFVLPQVLAYFTKKGFVFKAISIDS